jgi:N-methylhydantoinase B
MYIRSGDQVTPARTHRMVQIKSGEILGKVSGGGGGVGDPAEREPEKVLHDVINEYVTLETARDVYRVAIVPGDPPTLDAEATAKLRSGAAA